MATAPAPAISFKARWAEMDERLLAHLGAGDPGMQGDADTGEGDGDAGFTGSALWRRDPLSAGGDRPMAVFGGLREGLRQLAS